VGKEKKGPAPCLNYKNSEEIWNPLWAVLRLRDAREKKKRRQSKSFEERGEEGATQPNDVPASTARGEGENHGTLLSARRGEKGKKGEGVAFKQVLRPEKEEGEKGKEN